MAAVGAMYQVKVSYNGVEREVTVNPNQAVRALLQHALNEFGIRDNRNNFGLFNLAGQPIDEGSSVEAAGLNPGDQLLLRPRRVSGGGA